VLEKFDKAQRRTILAAVSSQLELDLTAPAPMVGPQGRQPLPIPEPAEPPLQPRSKEPLLDIRSLRAEKKPASAQQMIAVAGYYVQ